MTHQGVLKPANSPGREEGAELWFLPAMVLKQLDFTLLSLGKQVCLPVARISPCSGDHAYCAPVLPTVRYVAAEILSSLGFSPSLAGVT